MSRVKMNENLFLEVQEMRRLVRFLKDDGYSRLENFEIQKFGIVNNSRDTRFKSLKIVPGSSVDRLTLKAGYAIDASLNIIANDKDAVDVMTIPTDNVFRYIKISYQFKTTEIGTVQISPNGHMTGTGTKFTEVLRGQPNFSTPIKFKNSTLNTGEYEVVTVVSDTLAILQGQFNAETNLQYCVLGTFTPGVLVLPTYKEIYEYDYFKLTLSTTSLVAMGSEFLLARVRSNGFTLEIEDIRTDYLLLGAAFDIKVLSALSNPLVGLENIRYDTIYSDRNENLVKIGWGLKVMAGDWSLNNSDETIIITAGSGGRFQSIADFTDGDFNGWRIVFKDKVARATIVSSYKITGGNIKLELRDFNHTLYSHSKVDIVIVPDCEAIKFLALPSTPNIVNHFIDADSGTMEDNITGLMANTANTHGVLSQSTIQRYQGLLSALLKMKGGGGSTAWAIKGNTPLTTMSTGNLYRVSCWIYVSSVTTFSDTFLRIGKEGFSDAVITHTKVWNALTSVFDKWFRLEAEILVGLDQNGKVTIELGGQDGNAIYDQIVFFDEWRIVDVYELTKNIEENTFLNIDQGEGYMRLKAGSKDKLYWSNCVHKSTTPWALINDGVYLNETSFDENGIQIHTNVSKVTNGIFKVLLDPANFQRVKADINEQNFYLETETWKYSNAKYNAGTQEITLGAGNIFLVDAFSNGSNVKKISAKGVGTIIRMAVQNECTLISVANGGYIRTPSNPSNVPLKIGDWIELIEVAEGYWQLTGVFGSSSNTLTLQSQMDGILQVIGSIDQSANPWHPLYSSHQYISDNMSLVEAISALDLNAPPLTKIPIGGILMYSGALSNFDADGLGIPATPMAGWALCYGVPLTLPNGNSITTPDLKGRFIAGLDPVNNDYKPIGKTGGEAAHTLSNSEMPNHNHSASTSGDGSHYHRIWSDVAFDGGGGGDQYRNLESAVYNDITTNTDGAHNHSISVGYAGGGGAHENRPPYYVLAFLMRVY